MLDLSQIFISQAWAQGAAPAASGASSGFSMASISSFLPLILIFGVFYILIIRPQQQKLNEQGKMIKALNRGDRIVTSGGIYGKITGLQDDTLTVEIADGVNVKMVRAQVQSLAVKNDTGVVASENGDDEKKS